MRRVLPLFFLSALVLPPACNKVPITGRKQLNVVPKKIMHDVGRTTYQDMLSDQKLRTGKNKKVLDRVMNRIAKVSHGAGFDWTASLIGDDTINAWCLPGGYIGFYSGILPVLEHEAGMSFVMGHEVGHAVARHGAERLTQQLAVFGGLSGLAILLEEKTQLSQKQKATLLGAVGLGVEVGVVLPFSRGHESEADIIGLMYMASAGYPPNQAAPFWDRMQELSGGAGVPAFLSTHPSHDRRKEVINEWLPEARKKYKRNKLDDNVTDPLW